MNQRLIVMWAPPRSLSTAFLRVIAARGDFEILHEPMCDLAACGEYTHQRSDGTATVLRSASELFDYIAFLRCQSPVFVKDTCEFDYEANVAGSSYLQDAQHVFMLRDPEKVINSHYAVNPQLSSDEVGYRHLVKLYNQVKTQSATAPIFVEAERLSADPDGTIRAFCDSSGLIHIPESLKWEKGHLNVWQRTQHWHVDAANSTSIAHVSKNYAVRVDNHAPLQRYYRENRPFYDYLKMQACRDF